MNMVAGGRQNTPMSRLPSGSFAISTKRITSCHAPHRKMSPHDTSPSSSCVDPPSPSVRTHRNNAWSISKVATSVGSMKSAPGVPRATANQLIFPSVRSSEHPGAPSSSKLREQHTTRSDASQKAQGSFLPVIRSSRRVSCCRW